MDQGEAAATLLSCEEGLRRRFDSKLGGRRWHLLLSLALCIVFLSSTCIKTFCLSFTPFCLLSIFFLTFWWHPLLSILLLCLKDLALHPSSHDLQKLSSFFMPTFGTRWVLFVPPPRAPLACKDLSIVHDRVYY
jgi:hypothetical protein